MVFRDPNKDWNRVGAQPCPLVRRDLVQEKALLADPSRFDALGSSGPSSWAALLEG